jgi:isovaleryl-CoA dehydrogenase
MSGLDYERLVLAAGPIGIMQAAFDTTLSYIKERKQFGKKIGEFQLMQAKIQSSRAMLYSLTKVVDEGQLSSLDCASVIWYTSKCGTEVALESIQALGGNGYINDYPTGKKIRLFRTLLKGRQTI